MWLGCGSDVARMWLGCGSDMAQVWLGRVFGCGWKSLAELRGPGVASKCHEAIFAAQLPHNCPRRGGSLETGKKVLFCVGEAVWEAF